MDSTHVQTEDGDRQATEEALERGETYELVQGELVEADVVSAHELFA